MADMDADARADESADAWVDACVDARRAGFTLVEMIVCLALASLIGVLLINTMRIAGSASVAAATAARAEDVQSVRDHLRRTFGGLARRRVDGRRPPLRGGPDGLTAVIGADASLERTEEIAVSLSGRPRADGTVDLVEARAPSEAAPGAGARTEVLLERVAGFEIRYFGAQAAGTRPSWHATWRPNERQPTLMEISVAFPPGDRRRWSPLLVAFGDRP